MSVSIVKVCKLTDDLNVRNFCNCKQYGGTEKYTVNPHQAEKLKVVIFKQVGRYFFILTFVQSLLNAIYDKKVN